MQFRIKKQTITTTDMQSVIYLLYSHQNISAEQEMGYVRFEVFTAVTMKKGVFWEVTPCFSCKNRRFGGGAKFLRNVGSYKSHTV
jgi:hypothetical protein